MSDEQTNGTVAIALRDGTDVTVPVAEWVGPFAIHFDKVWPERYRVTHAMTGMACGGAFKHIDCARAYAVQLERLKGWDFTDREAPKSWPQDRRDSCRWLARAFGRDDELRSWKQ